ncbi:MAG: DEAD/DEAH box helicase [Chloroflexi bacterium]|nr:DEAD/DEAH box helicase [Chloroflexota bacterium]MBU1751482.1 DEAD/DEAH box helicase [Chloroflexota bacterium]
MTIWQDDHTPNLTAAMDRLRTDPAYAPYIVTWRELPALAAHHAPWPAGLDPCLADALAQTGIDRLYTHQAQAVTAALAGQSVVVVTPTASGKTLCYNLPVLHALLDDPAARALYLFPTKALAQDQRHGLEHLIAALGAKLPVATYDGDTPAGARPRIRDTARVLITNPDMLHLGILPHHTRWSRFLRGLRYVVVDEVHAYRGIFGSHVANVLRRLRRVTDFYGSRPTFVCCSATIANPAEHAQRLTGRPVICVDDDGAPRGPRHVALYNPPMVDYDLGIRRNLTAEARRITRALVGNDVQTVIFCRSRLGVEVLLRLLRRDLPEGAARGYRAGYLPAERRAIEAALRDGTARAVAATTALELGVDIGSLGAAILAGYPGTIASTWQQVGRAGRGTDPALAVLIAGPGPLDQYLAAHPDALFGRSPEHALIDPHNLVVLTNHLRCATFELPFIEGETLGDFAPTGDVLAYLAAAGELHRSADAYHWARDAYPAADVSLRTSTADHFAIVAEDEADGQRTVIGQLDRPSVPMLLHPGAIYLHEGTAYRVTDLDWDGGIARVAPAGDDDVYTKSSGSSEVRPVGDVTESIVDGGATHAHGPVLVRTWGTSYRLLRLTTNEVLGRGEIDLPDVELMTTAYWLTLTPEAVQALGDAGVWLGEPVRDYGPNWPQQKERARRRDGFQCRHCGLPERPDRRHDVHHIRPFRTFGYLPGENEHYRAANRQENLVTLCASCHRRAEMGVTERSSLAGLSTLLANLAPLYLMCSPGDLGVSAEAVPAGLRLPTIFIYDQAPGGVGYSAALFDRRRELLAAAQDLVADCPCERGCPACVGPVLDGDVQAHNTKADTVRLVDVLVSDRSD